MSLKERITMSNEHEENVVNFMSAEQRTEINNDEKLTDFEFSLTPEKDNELYELSDWKHRKKKKKKKYKLHSKNNDLFNDILSAYKSKKSFTNKNADTVYKDIPYPINNKTQIKSENSKSSDNNHKITLQYMQDELSRNDKLIMHDNSIYYYNGRTYKLISTGEDLLRLIRSNTSFSAFESNSIRPFNDLLIYLKTDKRLVPNNYENRLSYSKYLVVLRNGVLDLRTIELYEYSKKFLTFSEIHAKWCNKKPKEFIRYIRYISRDDIEIETRITESIGCMISSINECKVFFVAGTAQNSGKSVMGQLIKECIGKENVANISTNQMNERFALGNIEGKLLNISMDLPHGKLNPITVSIIKMITGDDEITIERKYQSPQTIHSNMRFLFGSNYPVTLPKESDEDSFWERMIIIPFLYSIPREQADHEMLNKLLAEKDAIISYCLRAFHKVIKNNFIFSKCSAADEMKAQWRNTEQDLTYTLEEFFFRKG